ncbi:hypothetical protein NA57DRAFT_63959 [Rhizodiscina lignyota]|uniref:Monooxygenase n=1 Tax=Rhizodiscina lignyota TaxID=1504668 RepID=A0A9P4IPQ4_9PEZI|nr:hypothetical protein NA57DRAFT_63959 [Rhizodiscina lignyota]
MVSAADFKAILRDQLSLSSWLALGAIVQGLLFLVLGRVALILPITLVGWRVLDAFLQAQGLKPNPHMEGVIKNKFSAQFPSEDGQYGNKPANGEVCVLLLGFKSNHPMQMLAPGFKETGDHFNNMMVELQAHKEENGLLGTTSWIGLGERTTANEVMTTFYFRSLEDVHNFANGKVHRDGWNWWNKNVHKHPHLTIWHEVFRATSGNWESIYVNSPPTSLSATAFKGISEETGEEVWHSPIVDARKGLLKTSAGRMSRSQGDEHDKYNDDPYGNYA